jgi:choline dehydrogenase-like flavoprotein
MSPSLTVAENRLRAFLKLLLFVSLLLTGLHLFLALVPVSMKPAVQAGYGLVTNNSMLQAGLIILLLTLILSDIRRFSPLIQLLKLYLMLATVWALISWIAKDQCRIAGAVYLLPLMVYVLLLAAIWYLLSKALKARYGLKFFTSQQFETLEALAQVCIAGESTGESLQIQAIEVASNVDNYLSSFQASSKWVMKLVLTCLEYYPMLSFKPFMSLMQPEQRLQFLQKRFLDDYNFKMLPDWYKQLIQAAIRMAKQLCFTGYYSDPRVYKSIGYIPFSERADTKSRMEAFPDSHSQADKLEVMTESEISAAEITADVVIVGSGAGASILANQLVGMGRKVLLIEKGNHEQPAGFNENEVDMVSRLYRDGALQLSRDFRFTVFQGNCVGGSTVVNNAVCFRTPEYILDRWVNDMNINLDRTKYEASQDAIYKMLHIEHTPAMTNEKYLNPGGMLFSNAAQKMGYNKPQLDSVMANINGCLGCGYCNMGCKHGRKLSMLDGILPESQIAHPGSLEIIAGCEAIQFNKKGSRIVSLTGKFKSGRKITIKGNTFVSSAGAISSSILLLKSKLGLKNAGKKLAFNLGSQITAAYKEPINSYDGLQISHYLKTDDNRFVMETWFNPPMFQSTAMPGWFSQHFQNMKDYNRMACTGVLVGTESNAEVRVAGLFGRDIKYVPTEDDFNSLMDGLELVSEIYLSDKNFERVMPNTFNFYQYKTVKELKENLRKNVKSSVDISTGTGHPQGGNVMAPDAATGVVDETLKVFGYDNLFVCDASVFPTSLGVNPQITVMTLAHYAAPFIAQNI